MWIFTPKGMVSCVRHTTKPDTILVRARAKSHILEFIGDNQAARYFHLDKCDYNHRAEISMTAFTARLLEHAHNITYPDFKGSIPKDPEFTPYYTACHNVWHCMNDFKLGAYNPKHERPLWQLEGDEVDAELDRVFGPVQCDPMDAIDAQFGEVFGTEAK